MLRARPRFRPRLVAAAATALALAVLPSCQTYDFEPVQPRALVQSVRKRDIGFKSLKPNLMLLLDKSGSMKIEIPGSTPTQTRMQAMQAAMSSFLANPTPVARMALALYPEDPPAGSTPPANQCIPASRVSVDFSPATADDGDAATAVERTKANEVASLIGSIDSTGPRTGGGTPTGASLMFLATGAPSLQQDDKRSDFVLLLTDGLPNCNGVNPNNVCAAANPACACTLSTTSGPACVGDTCSLGCLDRDATVQAVLELRKRNIRTIVVGFGSEATNDDARAVLNAVAEAGGFPRSCPGGLDSECGTDRCVTATKLCEDRYYRADNAAELSDALRKIAEGIKEANPCVWPLDLSSDIDPAFIAVIVNNQDYRPGPNTWTYADRTVTFPESGEICRKIMDSQQLSPVKVEVRAVEEL